MTRSLDRLLEERIRGLLIGLVNQYIQVVTSLMGNGEAAARLPRIVVKCQSQDTPELFQAKTSRIIVEISSISEATSIISSDELQEMNVAVDDLIVETEDLAFQLSSDEVRIYGVVPGGEQQLTDTNRLIRVRTAEMWGTISEFPSALDDEDAELHNARILADGGEITDTDFLVDLIADLKAGPDDCYALLDALYVPVAIKKDEVEKVETIYDLSRVKSAGLYYDCVQTTDALQQSWQDNQIDGKPWIMFSGTGGYVAENVFSSAQPATGFVICRKDGGGSTVRGVIGVRTNLTGSYLFYYENNTTQVAAYPGLAQLKVNTSQSTLGQFTVVLNDSSTNIRRKGISLGTGGSGTTSLTRYSIGAGHDGISLPHNGPWVFAAIARRSITTAQRDYIEDLLNTTHYPSTT